MLTSPRADRIAAAAQALAGYGLALSADQAQALALTVVDAIDGTTPLAPCTGCAHAQHGQFCPQVNVAGSESASIRGFVSRCECRVNDGGHAAQLAEVRRERTELAIRVDRLRQALDSCKPAAPGLPDSFLRVSVHPADLQPVVNAAAAVLS